MARPSKAAQRWRKIKEILGRVTGGLLGDAEYKAKPVVDPERLGAQGGSYRLVAERPSRNHEDFNFIQDILASSPAVESAISKLAQDAAVDENGDDRGWSIQITVDPVDTDDPKSEEAKAARKRARELRRALQRRIDEFLSRTNLGYKTQSYIEKTLSAGDCFAELDIFIDETTWTGAIRGIKELPTWQMFVIPGSKGQAVGYRQQTRADRDPIVWPVMGQIVHFRANPSDYFLYGRSELAPLRNRWEQFKLLEMDLFAAIHSRAVSPEVHYLGREGAFGDVSNDEIEAYKAKLLDDPTDINRFYVVKKGQTEIDVLTGDSEAIRVLADTHGQMEASLVAALGIPLGIAGQQADTQNRHHAAVQQNDYARRINSVRRDFTHPLDKVIELELALGGYDVWAPEKYGVANIDWEWRWPDLSESRTQRSARITSEYSVGLRSHHSSLYALGETDPDGEIAKILEERELGLYPLEHVPAPTPNGEQGKGVQAGPGAAKKDSNKKGAAKTGDDDKE